MTSLPKYYITTQEEIDAMKSNSLIFINCEYCNTEFSIQKKYLTLQLKNQNTYRTTCSSSCFIKLKSTDSKVITNCKTCNKEISKTKKEIEESKSGFVFCSKSCAATTTNSTSKLKYPVKNCLNCKTNYKPTRSKDSGTCSQFCLMEYGMKSRTLSDVVKRTHSNKYDGVRNNARLYAKYHYLPKCALCNYDKHFEVCHVKALTTFDNDETLFEVNNKTNLVHLCPNCHWEFDHNLIPLETIIKAQAESVIKE